LEITRKRVKIKIEVTEAILFMLNNKKNQRRVMSKKKFFMSFPPRLKGKAARGQFKPVRKKSQKKK